MGLFSGVKKLASKALGFVGNVAGLGAASGLLPGAAAVQNWANKASSALDGAGKTTTKTEPVIVNSPTTQTKTRGFDMTSGGGWFSQKVEKVKAWLKTLSPAVYWAVIILAPIMLIVLIWLLFWLIKRVFFKKRRVSRGASRRRTPIRRSVASVSSAPRATRRRSRPGRSGRKPSAKQLAALARGRAKMAAKRRKR